MIKRNLYLFLGTVMPAAIFLVADYVLSVINGGALSSGMQSVMSYRSSLVVWKVMPLIPAVILFGFVKIRTSKTIVATICATLYYMIIYFAYGWVGVFYSCFRGDCL